jgi:hypothetical protein
MRIALLFFIQQTCRYHHRECDYETVQKEPRAKQIQRFSSKEAFTIYLDRSVPRLECAQQILIVP